MRETERLSGMSGGPECQGITAAGRLMLEHDPEPEHATQVCRIALELFDGALRLHGLASEHRRLLTAAALLHDTGYSVDPMRHHKGSRDIILASILPGFAKQEQAIIACVARYHRKAHPKESHKVFCDLPRGLQEVVRRLAAILRVADGLDRSHCASVCAVRVRTTKTEIRLHVGQRRPNAMDINGAMKKRRLFEEVFGRPLDIVPEVLGGGDE